MILEARRYCFFGTVLSVLSVLGSPGTWDEGQLGGGWDGRREGAGTRGGAGTGREGAQNNRNRAKEREKER